MWVTGVLMSQWGSKDNVPTVGVASTDPTLVQNFTGEESWRYVADLSCKKLTSYVQAGMRAETLDSGTAYDIVYSDMNNSCIADGKLNCSELSFALNCEDLPNGVAVYNQVDTENCQSWILMLVCAVSSALPASEIPPFTRTKF